VLLSNAPGDFLSFRAPVAKEATYRVVVHFAKASDLATVQLSIDGHPQGALFDGYNAEGGWGATHVVGPATADLGTVSLTAGDHELRFEAAGRNPESTGYVMAIDCMVLTPQG
jgi:hypothetical protein